MSRLSDAILALIAGIIIGASALAIADDAQHALTCSKITTRVTPTSDPLASALCAKGMVTSCHHDEAFRPHALP